MVEPTGDLLTATEAAGDNQTQGTQTENWYPEEYKDIVAQRGWSGSGDVLKSYVNLDKEMGGRLKMPTPESSAEEVSAFYAKIGRPENPDGYEIKDVPENVPRDEGIEAVMRKVAFENGIPKAAFEAQVKSYLDAMSQSITQARVEGENALKGKWKDKYDTNLEIARRFAKEGGEEFFEYLEKSGIGNLPVVVEAFYLYGTKTLDDSLIRGDAAGEPKTDYVPKHINSPEQYETGDDDDSKKARAYFRAKGHVYGKQD